MVEASYNPVMPFEWKAFHVQLIPTEKQGSSIRPPHGHPMHSTPDMRSRQAAPLPRAGPYMGQSWPDKGVLIAGPGTVARTSEMRARESCAS